MCVQITRNAGCNKRRTCNPLQHSATRCNMLPNTAIHCNTVCVDHEIYVRITRNAGWNKRRTCNRLQHSATRCNMLRHTATLCVQMCVCECTHISREWSSIHSKYSISIVYFSFLNCSIAIFGCLANLSQYYWRQNLNPHTRTRTHTRTLAHTRTHTHTLTHSHTPSLSNSSEENRLNFSTRRFILKVLLLTCQKSHSTHPWNMRQTWKSKRSHSVSVPDAFSQKSFYWHSVYFWNTRQ